MFLTGLQPLINFLLGTDIPAESDPNFFIKEKEIAKLKADGNLDFESKKIYLEYLTNEPFSDALLAVYSLSKEYTEEGRKIGFETIEDLLDRDTLTDEQKAAIEPYDDLGVLRRLRIIYDENLPSDLTDAEIEKTAEFFASQMEINRVAIQTKFHEIFPEKDKRFIFASLGSKEKGNIKNIIFDCMKYNFRNKKHIAYCLATAKGEAQFLPIMETIYSDTFNYSEKAAKAYYSGEGKKSYNKTSEAFTGQIQLSDYLISKLTTLNFIQVVDLVKREFTKGVNIDDINFAKLKTLLTTTLSEKDATTGQWTDKTKNKDQTEDLFAEMKGILNMNTPPQRIISDEILKNADFFRYAGKGFIQTTGKASYFKVKSKIKMDYPDFNVDLENEPEKLLYSENAVLALVIGLKQNAYGSGEKLEEYLKVGVASTRADWKAARNRVNRNDKDKSKDMFGQCARIYADLVFRLRS